MTEHAIVGAFLMKATRGVGQRKAHWQERKEAYLAHLRKADEDILRVSLADKVHNARAILRDLRKPDIGEEIWARLQSAQGADAMVLPQPRRQVLRNAVV